MRAAVTRKGRLIVDQVPDPIPAEGQLLVAPLATGICGSDLHALGDFDHFIELAASQGLDALDSSKDMIFGHEFCAEILENGPGTTGALPLGTRVCSIPLVFGSTGIEQIGYSHLYPGAMGERMILQEMFVLPVPDSVPTDLAALTEPLAVGEHAVGLADIEQGQPALVVGCGPVGLAVIAALRARGLGPIIAADFSPTRRSLAESFGVDEVIDPAELSPHSRWTEMGIPMTLMDRVMAQALGSAASAPVIFEAVGIPGMIQSTFTTCPLEVASSSSVCACTVTALSPSQPSQRSSSCDSASATQARSSQAPWPALRPGFPAPLSWSRRSSDSTRLLRLSPSSLHPANRARSSSTPEERKLLR